MTLLHEMEDIVARHAPDDMAPSAVPGLQLYRSGQVTAPTAAAYWPMLCLVISGAKQTLLGEATYTYRAGDCLVVSAELPVSGRVFEAPYRAVSVDLRPAMIGRVLMETGGETSRNLPPPPGITVTRMSEDLLDPIARLLRLLDRPGEVAVMAPMIEREIVWRLLGGPHADIVREIGSTESRLAGVGKAIGWLRRHYAEAISLEDLSGLAGMSLSTFHRHFRTVTTMSPLQFQKQVRLQEARARLLIGGEGVADAGFAVGYNSPSQFSREYARLFGEPPARDVARMRAG